MFNVKVGSLTFEVIWIYYVKVHINHITSYMAQRERTKTHRTHDKHSATLLTYTALIKVLSLNKMLL